MASANKVSTNNNLSTLSYSAFPVEHGWISLCVGTLFVTTLAWHFAGTIIASLAFIVLALYAIVPRFKRDIVGNRCIVVLNSSGIHCYTYSADAAKELESSQRHASSIFFITNLKTGTFTAIGTDNVARLAHACTLKITRQTCLTVTTATKLRFELTSAQIAACAQHDTKTLLHVLKSPGHAIDDLSGDLKLWTFAEFEKQLHAQAVVLSSTYKVLRFGPHNEDPAVIEQLIKLLEQLRLLITHPNWGNSPASKRAWNDVFSLINAKTPNEQALFEEIGVLHKMLPT